jgi:hypothetical protein
MSEKDFSQKPTLPLKSLAGALLFAVLLGPVGLLYASSVGGIVMILIFLIVLHAQLFGPLVLVWVGSCIWSVLATNRYNKKAILSFIVLDR